MDEIFNYGANELGRPEHIKNEQVNVLLQFYKWCCFDVQAALSEIYSKGLTNDRAKGLLEMRSKGATLEQAGIEYNITRERVRQIEAKSARHFV